MARSNQIKYLRLTEARRALGLTNEQVALALGVKPAWWRGLLVGRCVASPEETDRIVALLGVPREQIPHVHRPEHQPVELAAVSE